MLGIILNAGKSLNQADEAPPELSFWVDVCFLNGLDVLKILSDPKKQIFTFPVVLLNFA